MNIQLSSFFLASFCFVLSLCSIPLICLPSSELEQRLWRKLNIRGIRQWVIRKRTEKWAQKSAIHNIEQSSRRNIAWHGLLTFTFGTVIIQAQSIQSELVQYGLYLFVLPSLAYFFGSIIQRQKLVIMTNRKKRLSP